MAPEALSTCPFRGGVVGSLIVLSCCAFQNVAAQAVYEADFDALTVGVTEAYPGVVGHDGWYAAQAVSPAYGEIQSTIAVAGNALHHRQPAGDHP